MTNIRNIALLLSLLLCIQTQHGFAQSKKTKGSFSYAFGLLVGKSLSEGLGLTYKQLDTKKLSQNMADAFADKITEKDISDAQMRMMEKVQALAEAKQSGAELPEIDATMAGDFGIFFGTTLRKEGLSSKDFNSKDFIKGFMASGGKGKPKMSSEDAETMVNDKMKQLRQGMENKNLEAGKKYLEEVAKKPDIQRTESGVYYEILTKGEGEIPGPESIVNVHYHGTLTDGTVFDSSVDRGETIEFGVNQVIQGWQDVLVLMPIGSKWRVYIPSNLAYGEQGASGGGIPPNAVLIFEIELFSFN